MAAGIKIKVFHFLIVLRCQKYSIKSVNIMSLLKANTLNRWISQSPPLLPMKSHWSCEFFPLVYQYKTLTFNGARFGLLASRHLRVNNNILLSLKGILSSPRNIDRSRADTWEISSLCLLQCGNFRVSLVQKRSKEERVRQWKLIFQWSNFSNL